MLGLPCPGHTCTTGSRARTVYHTADWQSRRSDKSSATCVTRSCIVRPVASPSGLPPMQSSLLLLLFFRPVTRWVCLFAFALCGGGGAAACDATVHRHGIVHRDIKPENIFLFSDGTCKVLGHYVSSCLAPYMVACV